LASGAISFLAARTMSPVPALARLRGGLLWSCCSASSSLWRPLAAPLSAIHLGRRHGRSSVSLTLARAEIENSKEQGAGAAAGLVDDGALVSSSAKSILSSGRTRKPESSRRTQSFRTGPKSRSFSRRCSRNAPSSTLRRAEVRGGGPDSVFGKQSRPRRKERHAGDYREG
jgi:hypothetical protein